MNNVDMPANLYDYVQFAEVKRLLEEVDERATREKRHSISIVSRQSGEGKTFLTAALAIGHALHLRKQVLVVDTSGGEAEGGALDLADALGAVAGGSTGPLRCAFDGVRLLRLDEWSSGGGTASEYEIGALVDFYREAFDLILIDTCSFGRRNRRNFDPLVITRRVGAAILVSDGRRVAAPSESFGVPLLGVVENRSRYEN